MDDLYHERVVAVERVRLFFLAVVVWRNSCLPHRQPTEH